MNSGSGILAVELVELRTSVLLAQRQVRVLGLDPRSEPVLHRLGVALARGSSHGKPRLARCPERAERGVDGRCAPFVSAGAIAGLTGADASVGLAEDRVVVGELPYGAYSCKECASLGVRYPEELSPRLESAMSEQRVQRLLRCKGVFNGSAC